MPASCRFTPSTELGAAKRQQILSRSNLVGGLLLCAKDLLVAAKVAIVLAEAQG